MNLAPLDGLPSGADPPRPSLATIDFQQLLERADVGICITQDDRLQYVNPKFARMHGYAPAELVGRPVADVIHPDEYARVFALRRLREADQLHAAYESRSLRRDGTWFDSSILGHMIEYGGRSADLVTVSDISSLAAAHRLAAGRARMLLSHESLCRSGSIEIDLPRRRVRLSAGAQTLIGRSGPGDLALAAALRCLPRGERALVLEQWRQARPGRPFDLRHGLLRSGGGLLRVLHRGVIESSEDGQARLRRVAILQDITEQTEAQAQVDQLLNYHPVTGLATQQRLLARAEAALEAARREQQPLAMLYLHVPDLDRVYRSLGLSAGDPLALMLAGRLVRDCREEDTTAHLGGGEFAILLDPAGGADEWQALNLATRLMGSLEAATKGGAAELINGGRIGISLFPGDAASAAELLGHAHTACNSNPSGNGSGNGNGHGVDSRIHFFTHEAATKASRRLRLEAGLRHAFERNELSLHYQPQVDLRDGRVSGAEALLRWQSQEFGAVSPAEFVPIAEEIGLIVSIGEWVFRCACEQSVAWAREGLPTVRIGVNLSPRQLEQADISQRLQSVLLETGADPAAIGIEVTESVLMDDLEHARRTLDELSAIGIEIALDDFGTGYSNLSVLRALPFDVLKIDRSLVHDVTAAPEDVSITRAVLMLAQGLKIKVLAEGVETEGQLDLLVSNGCDSMQGFVFSKPLPAEAMAQLLREGRCLPERFRHRAAKKRTLLLVDDEENMLSSLRRLLRSEGYQIVSARSGPEGLARLAEHDVDVIISDQRMPGMTGVEFLRRAKELYPESVRMVLSGNTDLQSITDAVNEGAIYKFLTKPWDDTRLRAHIAEAFRRKEMSDENQRLAGEVRDANIQLVQANQRQQALLARQSEQLGLEASRALNAQELLESLPTALIGIDADGMVAFVNRQARSLMGEAQPLVGCAIEQALPADWLDAWRPQDGQHRRIGLQGRRYLLSCAAMNERDASRGQLLSIVPELEGIPA